MENQLDQSTSFGHRKPRKRSASQRDLQPSALTEQKFVSIKRPKKPSSKKSTKTPNIDSQDIDPIEIPPDLKAIELLEDRDEEPNFLLQVPKKEMLFKDYQSTVVDEVALEGLDGITLQDLWLRLSVSFDHPEPFSSTFEEFAWDLIKSESDFEFFKLSDPRKPLKVAVQNSMSIVISEYPFIPINDTEKGIMGSCSAYYTRHPIPRDSLGTLQQVRLEFGNSLVIVASQRLRTHSLMYEMSYPLMQLLDVHYYLLEAIGRSRYQGITTAGPNSLASVVGDPKHLFYRRRILQQSNLIVKQTCSTRYNKGNVVNVTLLQLTRFFRIRPNPKIMVLQQIVNLLKQAPNFRMEYSEVKRHLGMEDSDKFRINKLFKSLDVSQILDTDRHMLYREMYPSSKIDEWQKKSSSKERILKVIELKKPTINVNFLLTLDDDVNEIQNDDNDEVASSDEFAYCDDVYNELTTSQKVYSAIFKSGKDGISINDVCKICRADFYCVRFVCKELRDSGMITQSLVGSNKINKINLIASVFTNQCVSESTDDQLHRSDNQKHSSDEESGSEALEFISKTLQVDKELIRRPREESSEFNEVKENVYEEMKNLRFVKNSDNLNELFENNRPMINVSSDLVPLTPPKVNSNIQELIRGTFSFVAKDYSNNESVYFDKTSSNESNIKLELEQSLVEQIEEKLHNKDTILQNISKFKLFEPLIRNSSKGRHYNTYVRIFFEQQAGNYSNIDLELDDEDEAPLEDIESNETLLSGLEVPYKEKVPDDIKRKICSNFQSVTRLSSLFEEENSTSPVRKDVHLQEVQEREGTKPETQDENLDDDPEKFFGVRMENFMGPKPKILSCETDKHEIITLLVESSNLEDFSEKKEFLTKTPRNMARIKLVVDYMQQQKHVVDSAKIFNMVAKAEEDQGAINKMARRSFFMILYALVKDGLLRIIKMILKFRNITRSKNIVILPNINASHVIQSALDQFKINFATLSQQRIYEEENGSQTKCPRLYRNRKFRFNKHIAMIYGVHPKVSKMKILHEFLHYLIREYAGSPLSESESLVIFEKHCGTVEPALITEASTVYSQEADWRMFVSPLPPHSEYPDGWALISDVLMRLPLSLFVKLHKIQFIIPELPAYLNHPIKRNFLVSNLPMDIKDALMGSRKYIVSIFNTVVNLVHIGLIQLGPQNLHFKAHVYIYLNHKAILYDTTSSDPGYHQITEKEYPKLTYNIGTTKELEKYWSDMFIISTSSKLGNRSTVIGKSIKLEYVYSKESLVKALSPQNKESVLERDVGYIPGDGLGACGLDSALWMHVRRNWIWSSRQLKSGGEKVFGTTGDQRKRRVDHLKQSKVVHKKMGARKVLSFREKDRVLPKKQAALRKNVVIRKVKPRKQQKNSAGHVINRQKFVFDRIDKDILDTMHNRRSSFDKVEDHVLIMAIASTEYLFKYARKRPMFYTVTRDFIHRVIPLSRKSSIAYSRRMRVYLSKLPDIETLKSNFKLESDFVVQKHFKKIREEIKNGKGYTESFLNKAYLYLLYYIYTKHKDSASLNCEELFQDYLVQPYLDQFNLDAKKDVVIYKNPNSEDDILFYVLVSVIHSSLGMKDIGKKLPLQMMKLYRSYSEYLLREALAHMNDSHLIASSKETYALEGSLQMNKKNYKLSFTYSWKLMTMFPSCAFTQANELLVSLYETVSNNKAGTSNQSDRTNKCLISLEVLDLGHCYGFNDLLTNQPITYTFDLPEDLITFNTQMLKDISGLVRELSARYRALMRKGCEDGEGETVENCDPEILDNLESSLEAFIMTQSKQDSATEAIGAKLEKLYMSEANEDGLDVKEEGRKKGLRISDLAFMLTKGLFPELDDDDKLEKLNRFFIVQYPTCKHYVDAQNVDFYDTCHKSVRELGQDLEDSLIKDCIIAKELPEFDTQNLTFSQKRMANEIVDLVLNQGYLGASAKDLKDRIQNLDVDILMEIVKSGQIIRTGVSQFAFVHYNYTQAWSIPLDFEESEDLNMSNTGCRIQISPWIRVNGIVQDKVLEAIMLSIMGHCLNHPFVTFPKLCQRFHFFKPVDLYQILEYLEKLTCLQLWTHQNHSDECGDDFFSEFSFVPQVPSKVTDDFEDVFVETDTLAVTKFGAFLNRKRSDFNDAFGD